MSVTLTAGAHEFRCCASRKPRLLLIAYSFPPVGGAGVQRPAKWTKYLPEQGWDVTVLTPENPSVPVRDESLLAELPPETRFVHAPTWEPGYQWKQRLATGAKNAAPGLMRRSVQALRSFAKGIGQAVLQPDPQVLWVHNAIRRASDELRLVKHDAILVTVPPYSSLMIGTALKKRFGLPLVFDFRDEWDLSSRYLEQATRGWWSQWIQSQMQRGLLAQADAVVATTQASAQTYQQKLAEVGNLARAHCIYNGFDPADFSDVVDHASSRADDVFRLVYTGTLWNLTDIEPVVTAVERVQTRSPELLRRLELVCVGRKTPDQQRLLERVRETGCRLESPDYCHHREVSQWLQSADALCLLLSDVPGAERVVPAKLFEYLAAKKNVLSIVPHGEAARLVRRFQPDGHFVPRDAEGIANWLIDRLSGRHATPRLRSSEVAIESFSRRHQTVELTELLNRLVGRPQIELEDEPLAEESPSRLEQPLFVEV